MLVAYLGAPLARSSTHCLHNAARISGWECVRCNGQKPQRFGHDIGKHRRCNIAAVVQLATWFINHDHGGEAWIAPTDHPAVQAAQRAVKRAFGKTPVFGREGGSIPIVFSFSKQLKVPCVLMGIGLNDDNLHAPNEKMDLDNFYLGNEAAAFLFEELEGNDSR